MGPEAVIAFWAQTQRPKSEPNITWTWWKWEFLLPKVIWFFQAMILFSLLTVLECVGNPCLI